MKKLMLFTLLTLVSQSSFAALTYMCNASMNNGTRYDVIIDASISEGQEDVVQAVRVFRNDRQLRVKIDSDFSTTRLTNDKIILSATDDHGVELVNVQYYGKRNKHNQLVLSLMGQKKLTFRDLKCELSQDF